MQTQTKNTWLGLAVAGCLGAAFAAGIHLATARAANDEGNKSMLAHNVYFSLKDSNEANRRKLIEACDKYLSDHPGTVFYAAGTVADLKRDVNDRDWDVGLHVVFKDRASHDAYQDAPKHLQFINENKSTWAKVRVFDTDLAGARK